MRRNRIAVAFLRIAWKLGITPSELADLRVAEVLSMLRGCP